MKGIELSSETGRSWQEIALDSWALGAEAMLVIGLRTVRIAGGGNEGCQEAKLMVTEKVDSTVALGSALLVGDLGDTPKAVIGNTVSHYLSGVRANRKRLSKR